MTTEQTEQHAIPKPSRVLVVDDEETIRRSIQKRLRKEGYETITTDNAIDALKIFENTEFDAVISDIRMKEMDGIELLRRIQGFRREVPIIMITGAPSLENAQSSVKEGAYDYIIKPIKKEVLLQTLSRAVEQKRLKDGIDDYRKNLEIKVREQTKIIQFFRKFANELNSLTEMEEVLNSVANVVYRFTQSEKVCIFLMDKRNELLGLGKSMGINDREIKGIKIPTNNSQVQVALNSKDARLIDLESGISGSELDRLYRLMKQDQILQVALKVMDKPLGLIVASERLNGLPYAEQDLQSLSYIADSAAVAINNKIIDHQLKESYFNIMRAMALAIEAKDPYTRGHSERARQYAMGLARKMGIQEDEVMAIGNAAILHDIGKIEISKYIIDKPDRLSQEEYVDMKDHPAIGEIMIDNIAFLEASKPMIRHHHERYDGQGYPDGLAGEEIPLGARIISVVDMYDALTTHRPYRTDTSKEKAILKLKEEKRKYLDPKMVDIFIEYIMEMRI